MQTLVVPTNTVRTPAARSDISRFTTFLGSRLLVLDRQWREGSVRLFLGFVRAPAIQVVFPLPLRLLAASYVDVQADGSCAAHLAPRDHASLEKLTSSPVDARLLESQVSAAVEGSLSEFLRGNELAALKCLQRDSDEEVFAVPPHHLKSVRALYIVSIAAGLVGLLLFSLVFWAFR